MPFLNPIVYLSNRGGIPRIESSGVAVNGTTDVRFSFSSDARFFNRYSGLVLVRLNQAVPTGTTATLPISFVLPNGPVQPVTGYSGTAVSVANLAGTGIYLAYYDAGSSTLQLLTGLVTPTA